MLAWFRRRALSRAAFESGAFAASAGALVSLLAVGAVAGGAPPALARALWALALLAATGVAIRQMTRAARRFRDARSVAHHLERCEPAFRSDLRAALDFAERDAPDADARALRGLLTRRVRREVESRGPALARFVPVRSLERERAAAIAGVFGLVVFALVAPDTFASAARALALPGAADRAPAAPKPLISSVDVRLSYPAYTGRERDRFLYSAGEVEALEGTRVQLSARLVEPVTGATFLLAQGDETERVPALLEGRVARAEFNLRATGQWELEVTRERGGVARDPVARALRAMPDRAPSVRIVEPTEDQEITPDHVVNVLYEAQDDFGLSGVSLVWAFVGAEDEPQTVGLQSDVGALEFEEHVPFDVAPLGLLPRDEILMWIEAFDNDTLDGPNVGRSAPIRLRIDSPEDISAALLADKEALFEALLTQLAGGLTTGLHAPEVREGRIQLAPASASASERTTRVAGAREVQEGWPDVLAQWGALNDAMLKDPSQRETHLMLLTAAYDRLADGVRDAERALESVSAAAETVPVPAYVGVATAQAPVVEHTEQAIVMLEDLIAAHQADDVQRALDELGDIRERLRELLERYRETQDPELRAAIERELARLEARMRELMERLAAQIPDLPTEHLNAEAIEPSEVAEDLQQMTSALDQMRAAMESGDIDAALRAMDQLDERLRALEAEVGDPLANAETDTLNAFDQALSDLMDEVNDIETLEASLEAETQELYDAMRARRAEETAEEVKTTFERLEQRTRELLQRHEGLERTRLSEASMRGIQGGEEGLERLAQRLSERDVSGADDAAERLISQLIDTDWELRGDEALLRRDAQGAREASRARRATDDAERAVDAMREELQRLMDLGRPRPTDEEQAEMRGLSARQRGVQERTEQLGQRLGELGEEFPSIPEQLGEPLQEAQQQMERAAERLSEGKARPAMQGEQQAMQQLRQMRQQLQQMSMQERQRQEQRGGRSDRDEEVEVPEESARGRQDYRERVIDAMRDDTLEAYDDEIRAYYESLLR